MKILNNLWWKYMPGETVLVRWPCGWTSPVDAPGGGHIQFESADPNDHYRPWLEANVGKQGWDWDWEWNLGDYYSILAGEPSHNKLKIKVRRKKANLISVIALKWS